MVHFQKFEIRIQVNKQPKIVENWQNKNCLKIICINLGVHFLIQKYLKRFHFSSPKGPFQISFLITVHHCGLAVTLKRTVINDRDEIILRYKMHGVLA